jgi:hypothetical protein
MRLGWLREDDGVHDIYIGHALLLSTLNYNLNLIIILIGESNKQHSLIEKELKLKVLHCRLPSAGYMNEQKTIVHVK